jgi:TIR domain
VPRIFMSSSAQDHQVAKGLAAELKVLGFDVWEASTSVAVGERVTTAIEHGIRSADVVLVLVSESSAGSAWVGREVEIATRYANESDVVLIPIFLGGAFFDADRSIKRLPYALQTRQGLVLSPASPLSYREVANTVRETYQRRKDATLPQTRDVSGPRLSEKEHRDILRVVSEAFAAAGRPLRSTQLVELLEPGPVWVASEVSPTGTELDRFAEFLRTGRIGYLVHVGDISRDAQIALDQMRLGGTPVVTVTARALHGALADQRVSLFLSELEIDYGTKDNLFDTRNALIDERFLFGRDVMLNTVGSAIRRREHVLLTGLRKVGKTSLLNVLRQHLVTQPVCHVDLQRYDRHHEDWPPALFRLMLTAFDNWGRTEHHDWPFEPSWPKTATELEEGLDARAEYLRRDRPLVVIADELERVFPAPGEPDATRRWIQATGALRFLSQGARRHVVVLGADLRPTTNRNNDFGPVGTNPFFALFQEMPVPLLDRTAVADMIESLGRAMGVDVVTIGFLDRLFKLTGGHPSLVRTIAAHAYRTRIVPNRLDETDLARALEHLDDTDAITFFLRANIWQLMTTHEQEVIMALARRPSWRGRMRTQSESYQMAHATLTEQGLVDRNGIRIELFRTWVHERGGS